MVNIPIQRKEKIKSKQTSMNLKPFRVFQQCELTSMRRHICGWSWDNTLASMTWLSGHVLSHYCMSDTELDAGFAECKIHVIYRHRKWGSEEKNAWT